MIESATIHDEDQSFVFGLYHAIFNYLANLSEPDDYDNPQPRNLEDLLAGFYVSNQNEIWNETPFQDVAVPGGFDLLTVIDYSDVGVLINNNSEESKTIGWAFANARNIRRRIYFSSITVTHRLEKQ